MKLATAPQDVMLPESFEQRDVAVGDVAFILDLFADKIYSNKERAVIRELACNAHDSHVMAGTTDVPFNVHLPTALEPWFSIRDYGTGLKDNEIAEVYGAIGVSTKRDSNEVIGCFGIGSLSPYSMCDSFVVKSYLNGTARTYQCMRDEKRQPKVIPLGSAPTNEPNGLEVKLTVAGKVSRFEEEAEQVFMFWEGTLPKINNQQVIRRCKEMRDAYIFKGDDFGLTPSWGNMYALMGNIAYKIPSQLDEFDVDGYLKFELGELEFDTARENLSMTDKTKAALKAKFASVKDSLKDIAIEQIEEKTTPFEQAKLAETLRVGRIGQFIGRQNLDEFVLPEPSESVTYWQAKYRGSEKYSTQLISADDKHEYYIHKDRMQTRIKNYLKDMNSGHTMFIFKDMAQVLECNIPVEKLSDLDDLPKVERTSYRSGNVSKCKTLKFVKGNYRYNDADYWNEYDLELDGSEVVYVEVNRNKVVYDARYLDCNSQVRSTIESCEKHIGDIELVGLKTAFLKTKAFRDGNFIHLHDYLKRELATKAPKSFHKFDSDHLDRIQTINRYIQQNEVSEIINLAQSCKNVSIADFCEKLGVSIDTTEDTSLQDLMDKFNDKYSMLTIIYSYRIGSDKEIIARYLGGTVRA
jgi:hypothetical protein